jgi:hypothetical protein
MRVSTSLWFAAGLSLVASASAQVACDPQASAVDISTFPTAPEAGRATHIVLRGVSRRAFAPEERLVRFNNGVIELIALGRTDAWLPTSNQPQDHVEYFLIGTLPQGRYPVRVFLDFRGELNFPIPPAPCLLRELDIVVGEDQVNARNVREFASLISQPYDIDTPARSGAGYVGVWSEPSRPGWGLLLSEGPRTDLLVGALTGVHPDGRPRWLTVHPLRWTDAAVVEVVIYQTSSSAGDSFVPTGARSLPVGAGTLTFVSPDVLLLEAQVDGEQIIRQLSRLPF